MNLGCFSVSLAVQDIVASVAFYQELGFVQYHGDIDQGWVMMKNGDTNLGLFQGMFEQNIMTFNPGWDQSGKETDAFEDVREIQQRLLERGVEVKVLADDKRSGPAHMILEDPDGNQIMLDQHR